MSRYVSFFVLLGVIGILIVLFYKVMASFFVPLFLALLLVVIFRPIHVWMLDKLQRHRTLSALLTTAVILLLALTPLAVLFGLAATEGQTMMRRFSPESVISQTLKLRDASGLTLEAVDELRDLETRLVEVSIAVAEGDRDKALRAIKQTDSAAVRFMESAGLPANRLDPDAEATFSIFASPSKEELWGRFLFEIEHLRDVILKEIAAEAAAKSVAEAEQKRLQNPLDEQQNSPAEESKKNGETPVQPGDEPQATDVVSAAADQKSDVKIESPIEEPEIVLTMDQQLRAMMRDFDSFKTTYSGGKSWAWLKLLANPTREEVDDYGKATATFLREQLFSLGGATTAFLGRLLLGLVVMVISMYFFFLDGPKMIDALRGLSPLDDDHERELIEEFDRVSRAVVLATLLSALAQGLLAGIGFAVVGVDNVFLLTMLTVCMSLVPFFGAASVWFPVCVWLYFVELRIGAAIGLGIFGFAVVSTVDNLIKPYVLHGQSNIHPLIALLSVLGGVSAMGPMGILVGPMIVVFLQTVLKILQREMTKMDRSGMSRAALAGANVPLNLEGEELATDRNDSAEQGGHAGLEPSADNSQKGLSSASHPTHPPSSSNKPSGEKRPKRKRR